MIIASPHNFQDFVAPRPKTVNEIAPKYIQNRVSCANFMANIFVVVKLVQWYLYLEQCRKITIRELLEITTIQLCFTLLI